MHGSDQKLSHLSYGDKRDGAGWVTGKDPETGEIQTCISGVSDHIWKIPL